LGARVVWRATPVPFFVAEQIEHSDVQVAQQNIADLRRQHPHAFKHIVQVGLRNAGTAGETSFRQFAALYTILHMRDQPVLQQFKIHKV